MGGEGARTGLNGGNKMGENVEGFGGPLHMKTVLHPIHLHFFTQFHNLHQ